MAKNRNKKKLKGSTAMEISSDTAADCPQGFSPRFHALMYPSLSFSLLSVSDFSFPCFYLPQQWKPWMLYFQNRHLVSLIG
ncbi:hypothetical protein IEQ34_011515 [Dendrobium chrysotoxum]|uniref:Uncharacterized protein n=1 Tax=Dendrobium chrysotoxum TaxID=161865 RepID=A0AAV7GQ30_DENCH|nr:hypothetical protein IEQ34_011515 [Dendrobium chrysotoxum]